MKKRNRGLIGKVGICILMFSFILLPIAPSICMAAQATNANAGGGVAGSGAALGLSPLALIGIALAIIITIAAIAAADDDDVIPAADHASGHAAAHH